MPCADRAGDGTTARLKRSRPTCSARCRTASSRRRICRCAGPIGMPRSGDPPKRAAARRNTGAPSRIGQIPTYGLPAANGACGAGFDSLNRTRKKPKLYPGQAKPKPSPGPGSPAPPPRDDRRRRGRAAVDPAIGDRQQDAAAARDGRHGRRPAAAQAPEGRRRSVRRGRRLRRQLPDQVGGRTQRRLRQQSRPAARSEGHRRSM